MSRPSLTFGHCGRFSRSFFGEEYEDGSGTKYLSLIGQPILIYGADRPALSRALERALARQRDARRLHRGHVQDDA